MLQPKESQQLFRQDAQGGGHSLPREIPGQLPKDASLPHQSMRALYSKTEIAQVISQIASAEASNIRIAQNIGLEKYTTLLKKEKRDLSDAVTIASVESAVYIQQHPHLLLYAPEFPAAFRLMRSAELCGGLKRGGNSLLIGSGSTTPEYLALYIAPPTEEEISQLQHQTMDENQLKHAAFEGNIAVAPKELPTLTGHATAIEPDPAHDAMFQIATGMFPIPENRLTRKRQTLAEAFTDIATPTELDTILWYRADPHVVGFQFEKFFSDPDTTNEQAEGIITTLFILMNALKTEGTFALTVGAGNSNEDRKNRVAFLKIVHEMFKTFPIRETPAVSGLYIGNEFTAGFFGEPNGSIAGLFTTKTDDQVQRVK